MKFVVYSPEYTPFSGGIIALHKLCENIKSIGEDCVMADKNTVIDDQTMVIYPEITLGNPLNAKHVTRLLLNTPGVIGGDGIYGPNDLVYKYANYFDAPEGVKVEGILSAFDFFTHVFYDKGLPRSGRCYAQKKYKADVPESPESIRIDSYSSKGNEWLADVFNKCETFYCYDNRSVHSLQAVMCGCESIIHDDGKMSKEEWRKRADIFKYGIAYGNDDLAYARETKHMVAGWLAEMQELSIQQTKEFVSKAKSL